VIMLVNLLIVQHILWEDHFVTHPDVAARFGDDLIAKGKGVELIFNNRIIAGVFLPHNGCTIAADIAKVRDSSLCFL
jgi:hypothetical protein